MAKADYYFPLYYRRLLTSTIGWKDDEFGAYLRLLIYQFDNGFIPSDLDELKRIAPSIKKHWPLISKKFKDNGTGNLVNDVMKEIHDEIQDKKNMRSEFGKMGGRPKNKNQNETKTKPKGIDLLKQNESYLITNNQELIISTDVDIAKTATAPNNQCQLNSETIKATARKAFDDKIWADATGMGHSITRDELSKWMAQFNASLVGDNISDFNERTYKKMFGGWFNKQKSKGYKLPEKEKQSSAPLKPLN